MTRLLRACLALLILTAAARAQIGGGPEPASAPPRAVAMSYADAAPVLAVMRDHLPPQLKGKAPGEIETAWPGWVRQRDAEIRGRIGRGDEDALVNLWLYGTTFTGLPPARARELDARAGRISTAEVLEGRLEDLVEGIAAPGLNERLRFARRIVELRGIDPSTAGGRADVRRFLVEARERALAEFSSTDRALAEAREATRQQKDPSFEIAAYGTIFQDRGLASDTSILPMFGVEQALSVVTSQGVLGKGSVRRVAVVGPGLDFINKTDGYDFYPPQTIQPFALVDSLTRLGLARPGDVEVTTLDVNPRVNEHVEAARARAQSGEGYLLQLPLARSESWDPALVTYWERIGDRVGRDVEAARIPPAVADLAVRAVHVSPDVVRSIRARDLNIVVQRLEPLEPGERFDVVVATNILVYYEPFEQSLALANAAAMLRPGGILLVNSGVVPAPPLERSTGYLRVGYSSRQYDHFFWYRREPVR